MRTSVYFKLDTRNAKKDGTFPLKLRIIHKSIPTDISMGYSLLPSEWSKSGEKIKTTVSRLGNVSRLNALLQKKKLDILNLINQLEEENKLRSFSSTQLKRKLLNQHCTDVSLNCYLEDRISELREAQRYGNADIYEELLKILNKLTGNKTLAFTDINFKFLNGWEVKHMSRGNSYNSLSVYMRTLRALYNHAIKEGVVAKEHYPFQHYVIKKQEVQRHGMSKKDFQIFRNLSFTKNDPRFHAYNFFMISFYLRGMNWKDMCLLTRENVIGDLERIVYRRSKTGKPFSIKILQVLKCIFSHYHFSTTKNNRFLLPILKCEDDRSQFTQIIRNKRKWLNKWLRRIAKENDLEPFSIYTARHTWATHGKRIGVPTTVLQEGLGHATELQTQEYLESFENSVLDKYDQLIASS